MNTIELLDALQLKAKKDPELRKALFATRSEKNPVDAFCKKCQEEGYPIYTMDLIQAGEEFLCFHASQYQRWGRKFANTGRRRRFL